MRTSIPIEPDPDTARRWLEEELAKDEYTIRPSGWFQRFQEWIMEVIDRLMSTAAEGTGLSSPGALVLIFLVAAVVGVILYLVLGPLRRSHRVKRSASVFEDDDRPAAQIRSAALTAAAGGDWTTAVIERFRALVRATEERSLVLVVPGMTAREFTAAVGERLEEHAPQLRQCADIFDGVRYGHRLADQAAYELIARTDDEVARARPKVLA